MNVRPMDNLTLLQYLLAMLDAALTGKDWKTVLHTASSQSASTSRFLEGDHSYYLSDGGYSRVAVNILDGRYPLYLTSNSRDEVKQRWVNCKELILDAETELHRLLRVEGWME